MKQFEVKTIVTMVFPNVGAKTIDEAIARVAERIPATINSKAGVICGITIDDFDVKCNVMILWTPVTTMHRNWWSASIRLGMTKAVGRTSST